jgi:hypothetical protein
MNGWARRFVATGPPLRAYRPPVMNGRARTPATNPAITILHTTFAVVDMTHLLSGYKYYITYL